jgi:hypothetical protein
VKPVAISRQNARSTSRRSDGAPGDFIADLPVNAFIHPAGLPTRTSTLEVLRGPLESALRPAVGVHHHDPVGLAPGDRGAQRRERQLRDDPLVEA